MHGVVRSGSRQRFCAFVREEMEKEQAGGDGDSLRMATVWRTCVAASFSHSPALRLGTSMSRLRFRVSTKFICGRLSCALGR